jgi:hypothetical protein
MTEIYGTGNIKKRGKSLQDIKNEKLWADEETEDLWSINLCKAEMMLGEG